MRKLTVGTILKARGGWDAVVVWVRPDQPPFGAMYYEWRVGRFYAIHQPGVCGKESKPIRHNADGHARESGKSTTVAEFSILDYELPCYNNHPADLDMTDYEL